MLFNLTQKAAPTVGSIVARSKAIVIKGIFTDDDQHSYFKGYRYESEADALADTDATDLDDEVRNRKYRDDDELVAGTTYWYRFSSIDSYENESEKSVPVYATYRAALDNDNDQTPPNQPGTPTLTSRPDDYDKDGTTNPGLKIEFDAPTSGRSPKEYRIEIWRRRDTVGTSGSLDGYELWKKFSIDNPPDRFRANARFFHKARVVPKTANKVFGTPSAFNSVGVQPSLVFDDEDEEYADKASFAPSDLSTKIKGNRTIIYWDMGDDPRVRETWIFASATNDSSTATRVGIASEGKFVISDEFDDGEDIYIWLRNVTRDGKFSLRYPDPETTIGAPETSYAGYHPGSALASKTGVPLVSKTGVVLTSKVS